MTQSTEPVRRATVLCVDDEPGVLHALQRVLCRYGCRVLLANTGLEALELLKHEPIEVLICDEAMPGMRGTEVLREAKVISPATARVLLTAHCGDPTVVVPAVNEGEVFRLLPKPWEDGEVRRVVAEALGQEPELWWQSRQRVQSRLRNGPHGTKLGVVHPGVAAATKPDPGPTATQPS